MHKMHGERAENSETNNHCQMLKHVSLSVTDSSRTFHCSLLVLFLGGAFNCALCSARTEKRSSRIS